MRLRIQRGKIPVALVIIFLLLLTAKDFIGISIPGIVFTALWMMILLFADEDTSTAFTLSSVICFASTLSITIPCVFYIFLNLFRKKSLKLDAIFLTSIYVALIEFFRLVAGGEEDFRLYVNSMAVLFLVYTVISKLKERSASADLCIKYYIACFAFLSLDIIWATVRSLGNLRAIISGSFRIGQVDLLDESMTGIFSINANGIALMSVLAVSSVMLLMSKKYFTKKMAIPLLIYFSAVGLLTVSKTFILVYAGFWCLYVCWYSSKSNTNIFKPFALVGAFILIIVFMWNTDIVQNVIVRFDTNDLTTGRVDVAVDYFDYMEQNRIASIIGIGLQNVTSKTALVHVPHNAILEIYVCFGIVGIIAYSLFFMSLVRSGIQKCKTSTNYDGRILINLIPFISFFVFIQSLQFLRINYIYASIAIAFAAMILTEYNGPLVKTISRNFILNDFTFAIPEPRELSACSSQPPA